MKRWQLFYSPGTAWLAMLSAIWNAQETVEFENYILEDDHWGRQFLELFLRKAKEGVKIRILCDAFGSRSFYNSLVRKELEAAGAEIIFFNRFHWWWLHRFTSWVLRDHRKILIIDGKHGFVGGVCVRDSMEAWRDTDVSITGPVVIQIQQSFNLIWDSLRSGKRLVKLPPLIPLEEDFYCLTNAPRYHQRLIYWELVKMIKSARKYIYINSPFLIPDFRISWALRQAVKRGVAVKIIISQNAYNYFLNKVAITASSSYVGLALRSGLKIYDYEKNNMMHAKSVVVDDIWATVGSTNLDNLSLLLNYEGNLFSRNVDFVKEIKEQFLVDLKKSELISYSVWHRRPIRQKLREILILPFRRLL